MACLSCKERQRLIMEGIRQVAKGQTPAPQIRQINQTFRNDLASIKARLVRPQNRGR